MKTCSPRTIQSVVIAALASMLLLPAEVRAQEPPEGPSPVIVGSRVRLVAPAAVEGRIEGLVMAMDEKSLMVSLDDGVPVRVSRQAITQLAVRTGRYRRWLKGMIIGASIGAVAGALVGNYNGCFAGCTASSRSFSDRAQFAGLAAFSFAAWGAGIGALIKGDRWSAVPLERVRVNLAPTAGRGIGLSLSLGF